SVQSLSGKNPYPRQTENPPQIHPRLSYARWSYGVTQKTDSPLTNFRHKGISEFRPRVGTPNPQALSLSVLPEKAHSTLPDYVFPPSFHYFQLPQDRLWMVLSPVNNTLPQKQDHQNG